MRQLSTRDQMTQKLTTIGHRTTINNEQSLYRIVSYKRPRNDNVKQCKSSKLHITTKLLNAAISHRLFCFKLCLNTSEYLKK